MPTDIGSHAATATVLRSGLLAGDIAVVTGGAQGNGAAIARGLAHHGARVAIVDVNPDGASHVAEDINADGGQAVAVVADVSTRPACEAAAAQISERLGDASILVNSAGILRVAGVDDSGFDSSFQAQYNINVLGTVRMIHALLPQLRRTRGRVITLGSVASFLSVPAGAGYAASKGAILQLTKTLAAELAADGIRVNGISPGVMVTPMTEDARSNPEISQAFLRHTPMARFGQPEELVGPTVFLASSLSSYVTGVMLPVDGGYLIF
jgi:NAD(P)-dependent dehydrogenase (short-subunit alcohol dehydrogenase family)